MPSRNMASEALNAGHFTPVHGTPYVPLEMSYEHQSEAPEPCASAAQSSISV